MHTTTTHYPPPRSRGLQHVPLWKRRAAAVVVVVVTWLGGAIGYGVWRFLEWSFG